MTNSIKTDIPLALCSQCPFTCKGQLYCTRDNFVKKEDVKQINSTLQLLIRQI